MAEQVHTLTAAQIRRLNRIKRLSIHPGTFLCLILAGTTARVEGPALRLEITLREAFML